MDFSATTLVIGSNKLNCDSCSIKTTSSSPTLISIVNEGYSENTGIQTLKLTGRDFPTQSSVVAIKLSNSITSSSETIDSATQITAVFQDGIGFGTGITIESIEFSDGSFAKINEGATIDQNLNGAADENVNCSFAGGCLWSYSQANINWLARSLSAYVCGIPCLYD